MIHRGFRNAEESHDHSREILDLFYEYDDFMASIGTLVDMGCGTGLDLEWWATRTTREDTPKPLNIKCTGIDRSPALEMAQQYSNIGYRSQDFEDDIEIYGKKYDVVWCHDAFQYAMNPVATLSKWWEITSKNGMLVLSIPQTTEMEYNKQAYDQPDFHYYNWTIVSLIHALSVSGWDCAAGFFHKAANDPWLTAVVYKGTVKPMDPRSTRWYELAEKGLLPETAAASVNKYGYLRQRDLVLPWLDRSLTSFAQF